jgi:hypothetical protein
MWRGLSIILVLLIIAVGFYISRPDFLRKINDFTAIDVAVLLSIPAVLIAFHFINRYVRRARLSSRDVFWLSITLVSVAVISALVFYVTNETGRAILVASYLASLGWIYTNYVNAHMQRKSHTMNVLVQLRNSTEFNKHRNMLLSRFPLGRRVIINDLPALKTERASGASYAADKVPILDSAYYIANYYEFISVGVLNGDLDDTMVEHTLRSILVNWFDHLEPIIYDARIESNGRENMRIFRSYIALVTRYKNMPP